MLICNSATVRQADVSATIVKEKNKPQVISAVNTGLFATTVRGCFKTPNKEVFKQKWAAQMRCLGKKAFLRQHHTSADLWYTKQRLNKPPNLCTKALEGD